MFEYIKELLNQQLEKDMKEFDKLEAKKDDIENEISRLSTFETFHYELKADNIKLKLSICLSVIIPASMIFVGANVLVILATLLSLFKIVQYKRSITEIQKLLNNYPEYINLSVDKLNQAKNELANSIEKTKTDIKIVENSVIENVDRLNMLDREDLQEYFSTGLALSLRDIKDYDNLIKLREEIYNLLLNNYLDERKDYSEIHFTDSCEYSRKLIKKM